MSPTKTTKKKKTTRADRASVQARLELDAVIYKKSALVQAQKAFADLARISFEKKGSKQIVHFSQMAADVAGRLPDEFANYALGCLVVNR